MNFDFLTPQVVGIGIAVILLIIIVAVGYIKAPPDKAFIISGLRKSKRVIGKAAVRIPFLERVDKLDLSAISVDVKTSTAVPTKNYINVRVDSVVNIKIPTKDIVNESGEVVFECDDLMVRAQQNFLNKGRDVIGAVAKEVLEGNIREIVGQMDLEEMVSNRQLFAQLVKDNAMPDLAELGLSIVSFNVQNFFDDTGTIENLGIDNIEKIRKDAAISKAKAQKEIAIAESEAVKEANDARVASQLEISKANNELLIKQAELKRDADTKKAIAEAAYSIQSQEQRKVIEIKTAEANIAKQEKDIELAEQQAKIQERELEAQVKKVADAQKYKQEQNAEADKFSASRKAEAELTIATKRAEAQKITAEAKRYEAEQEAEGIRVRGLAEAQAIEAQGLAKAKGLDAEAEAMKKMEQAAIVKTIMEAMPAIAKEVATPLSKIDSITMYGEGNSAKMVGDITNSMSQIISGATESLGLPVKDLLSSLLTGKIIGNTISDTIDVSE